MLRSLFGIQADRFCALSNLRKGLYVLDESAVCMHIKRHAGAWLKIALCHRLLDTEPWKLEANLTS